MEEEGVRSERTGAWTTCNGTIQWRLHLKLRKNWQKRKKVLESQKVGTTLSRGQGPPGPCLGAVMGLLLLDLAPEADFRLEVGRSGPGGSDMGQPETNQTRTWVQNPNSACHRLRFKADLPKLSRGR